MSLTIIKCDKHADIESVRDRYLNGDKLLEREVSIEHYQIQAEHMTVIKTNQVRSAKEIETIAEALRAGMQDDNFVLIADASISIESLPRRSDCLVIGTGDFAVIDLNSEGYFKANPV